LLASPLSLWDREYRECERSTSKSVLAWLSETNSLIGHCLPTSSMRLTPGSVMQYAEPQFRYYTYPPQRDVVIVLGAGASFADGAPLQSNLLPLIVNDRDGRIRNTERGRQLQAFLAENFSWDEAEHVFPSLEGVFGFLDYFIQRSESLSGRYSLSDLVSIRRTLIYAIHFLLSRSAQPSSKAYPEFWRQIALKNRNVSVVSLNYDTLLEDAFDGIYQRFGMIDYCIHLMNYDDPEGMEAFNWWINPREPLSIFSSEDDPVPIKILKPHGSLNWKYCGSCNQVLLTPWDTSLDLERGGFVKQVFLEGIGFQPDPEDYICPLDGTAFEPLILPPSHVKQLTHPVINQIFSEILRELHAAKRVIFIGYSFPEADVHFRAIIKKAWRREKELFVIDAFDSSLLRNNYRGISDQAQFIIAPFQKVVHDDTLMGRLLAPTAPR
jgi:hypothetical protein